MLRAMDSAVSGLRAHQNKLDVIGHNIANVNTYGFKAQKYTFKDTMYQTSTASTNGTATAGGVNAAQYGYGALMGTISMDMTASTPSYQGGFNATIDGDGFFITNSQKLLNVTVSGKDDISALKSNDFGFTRVGQFSVDSEGYVVDGNGNFVYGFRVDQKGVKQTDGEMKPLRIPKTYKPAVTDNTGAVTTPADVTFSEVVGKGEALEAISVQINKAGDIEVSLKYENPNKAGEFMTSTVTIGTVALATFQNQDGLTKDGSGYYVATESDNTGTCSAGIPGDGRAGLMPGYLEASNTDMATEFSEMIMTQRGFQANSKIITVSDEILAELVNMKR